MSDMLAKSYLTPKMMAALVQHELNHLFLKNVRRSRSLNVELTDGALIIETTCEEISESSPTTVVQEG